MTYLDRRAFLQGATGAATLLLAGETAPVPAAPAKPMPLKWRGVNLGGWLVLEKWMTPSLFKGVDANDEYTFSQKLGKAKTTDRLQKHRETWITDADFAWIAAGA